MKNIMLIPLASLLLVTSLVVSAGEKIPNNVFSFLIDSKDHTITAKIVAAKLQEPNASKSNLSIFAPRNLAFAKVNKKYLGDNLSPESLALTQKILKHHATANYLNPKELKDGQKIQQINGETVTITVKKDKIFVDGIPVIKTVATSRGTVFIIDKILFPSSVTPGQLEK